jgi:hypothetical protein
VTDQVVPAQEFKENKEENQTMKLVESIRKDFNTMTLVLIRCDRHQYCDRADCLAT